MSGNKAVVGVFEYLDDTVKAIERANADHREVKVFSPFWSHQIEDATGGGNSPVRKITGVGAITGLVCGFSLAILTAMDYPLRVSAKDIVAPPAFVVIGYEWTILFGAIFTLLALLHFCRLPNPFRKVGYDPRFSDNRFGVVVHCDGPDVDAVKNSLMSAGAEEVVVRDGL